MGDGGSVRKSACRTASKPCNTRSSWARPGWISTPFNSAPEARAAVARTPVPALGSSAIMPLDRKRVVEGKSVSVRVDLGGRRIIKQKMQREHEARDRSRYTKI